MASPEPDETTIILSRSALDPIEPHFLTTDLLLKPDLETLVILQDFVCCFPLPRGSFENLTTLQISVINPDHRLMRVLFKSCPVLEDLSITFNAFKYPMQDGVMPFYVKSKTLTLLFLHILAPTPDFLRHMKPLIRPDPDHLMVIDAPKLETVYVLDCYFMTYKIKPMPLLEEVCLDIGYMEIEASNPAKSVKTLLRAVRHTHELELQAQTLVSLMQAMRIDDKFQLPVFSRIHKLILEVWWPHWTLILHILSNTPTLRKFYIVALHHPDLKNKNEVVDELSEFIVQNPVLPCFRESLGKVKIARLRKLEKELMVVRYLLQNAIALKVMRISAELAEEEYAILDYVHRVPKGSKNCLIRFWKE